MCGVCELAKGAHVSVCVLSSVCPVITIESLFVFTLSLCPSVSIFLCISLYVYLSSLNY